jgi:hypothetical protein
MDLKLHANATTMERADEARHSGARFEHAFS